MFLKLVVNFCLRFNDISKYKFLLRFIFVSLTFKTNDWGQNPLLNLWIHKGKKSDMKCSY